jgi:hypothetical protein
MGYCDDEVVVVGFYSAVMCAFWGSVWQQSPTAEYPGYFGFSPEFNKSSYETANPVGNQAAVKSA